MQPPAGGHCRCCRQEPESARPNSARLGTSCAADEQISPERRIARSFRRWIRNGVHHATMPGSAFYSQLLPARPRAIKSFRQAKAFDARRGPPSSWNQFHAAPLERRFMRGRDAAKAGGAAMTILKWALIFLVVSIIAGILGFTGISAASADIARFLFYVFVVIFLVLLILGLTIFRA